ncbi:hypothetical protein [Nocardia cyriacigeorgica]|uniref:hypothetical protein n=1 Tax=Nocardia cyriacigeorgica TaxID=135487 RepID=UPI0024590316|nr:hypothetical protein [Nocardia cyriacigeorgica]
MCTGTAKGTPLLISLWGDDEADFPLNHDAPGPGDRFDSDEVASILLLHYRCLPANCPRKQAMLALRTLFDNGAKGRISLPVTAGEAGSVDEQA